MPACSAAAARRPQRRAPALLHASARASAGAPRAARAIRRRVDAGELARRRPAPGCRAIASAFLASVERERREVVEVHVARVRVERARLARAARRAAAARRRARGSRAAARAAAARRASSSARAPARARLDVEAVAAQQVGEAPRRRSAPSRRCSASSAAVVVGRARAASAATRRSCGSGRAPSPITPIRHAWPASGPERRRRSRSPCSLQQRAAHRGLVDAVGQRARASSGCSCSPSGARRSKPSMRERVAQRLVGRGVARPARLEALLVDDRQRLAQRVDHVDRRGVVVGAAAVGRAQ